jgi:hypothetical protein
VDPLLVLIEPGLTHRLKEGGSRSTLEHGMGHWTEAIERFGANWAGETLLIANQAPANLVGITSIHSVMNPIVDPTRSLTLRAKSLLVRASDPLLAGAIGSKLMRGNWEAHEHSELNSILRSAAASDREVTIFAPTAIPVTAETIIRNAREYQRATGKNTRLKLRIRFSSQGQERRALHPSYFGLQLKRWKERAGAVDLKFGVEVESMAQRYSEIAGFSVSWVPWPNEVTGCITSNADPLRTQPHIYIYASRPEQGSHHSHEIVRSIQSRVGDGARFTVQIGRKGRLKSPRMIQELLSTPQVLLSDSGLLPAQLHAQFSDAHMIVLPYEVDRYRGRGSALMWGALDHAIPLIAPAGTGFGDDIARHGIGLSYQHRREIPMLVARILAERERYRVAIARYQEHRAAAVRAYFGEDEQLA